MTRLTPDLIEGVPDDKIDLDSRLLKMTGKTVKGLAMEAAGLKDGEIDLTKFRVAVVPITSGLGVISGFSASVDAIVRRLGMQSYVTAGTDVNGFAQAVEDDVDIIMMADDNKFVAYKQGCFHGASDHRAVAQRHRCRGAVDLSLSGERRHDVQLLVPAGVCRDAQPRRGDPRQRSQKLPGIHRSS